MFSRLFVGKAHVSVKLTVFGKNFSIKFFIKKSPGLMITKLAI